MSMIFLIVCSAAVLFSTLVHCMSSGSNRPSSNRRGLNRDPKIDPDIQKQYVPLLPNWDSQLPEVLEESMKVQSKVRAEDGRESVIDNI